jgi:hypothetical protein
MDMDKQQQEDTAALVFSYLIRGLSGSNRETIRAELMEKMMPIKALYGFSDDAFPLYVNMCMEKRRFLKVPEAIEAFGEAMEAGQLKWEDERAVMGWVGEIMRQNKTTGNVKTKRR